MKNKPIQKLLATVAASAAMCGLASAQLVHHWPFDEGMGTTTEDIAGDNDGNIVGATWGTDDTRDNYLIFNGTDNYVDPALFLPTMDLEIDYTWAAWVNSQEVINPGGGGQRNAIILGNRRDGNNVDFTPREFIKLTPRQFEWHFNGATTSVDNTDLPLDVWIHVAVVKTGDNIQTYYNGVPNTSASLPGAITPLLPFYIGGEPNQNGNEHFNGFIDDVRLYESALTEAEVQELLGDTQLLPLWTISPIDLDIANAGVPFEGTVAELATNPRDGALTYAKVSGPEWLTVAPDGTLGGTPTSEDVGENAFVVSATNTDGTAENDLIVTILDPNAVNPPLIAGWDNWEDLGDNTYDPAFTEMVTAQAVGTLTGGQGTIGGFTNAGLLFGASVDGSWGNIFPGIGIPAPDREAEAATAAVAILTESNAFFDFTVTANQGTSISFTSFNFDAYRRFSGAADTWTLSVVSGSISNGLIEGATGSLVNTNAALQDADPHDFDVDLTVLADRVLEGGETAVFRLEFTGGDEGDSAGNHALFDNVGIFGELGVAGDIPLSISQDGDNLVFTWDSEEGHLYNLRSETDFVGPTSGWTIVPGQMDIVATPPMNTVVIPRPADTRRFYVLEDFVPIPPPIFEDDFENGIGEWVATSTGDDGTAWELGTPTNVGPPNGANSGINSFGTNISADYDVNANVILQSPLIDLTEQTQATLTFAHYIEAEPNDNGSPFDSGRVRVLDSNNDLLAELALLGNESTSDWIELSFPLPSGALGQEVRLEFTFNSDQSLTNAGWYIDDVRITAP